MPGTSGPAFELRCPRALSIPVLIAVPHAGRDYPPSLLARMREPEWASLRLEDRHADAVARAVAQATGAGLLIAHAPRALIDLNRSIDDVDWTMIADAAPVRTRASSANRRARSGLGLVPRRLPGLGDIWKDRISRSELDQRIDGIHRPYHRVLGRTLEQIRDSWGAALLVDLHSMPPLRPGAVGERGAEFVVGDRFGASCDPLLAVRALEHLHGAGRAVAHNRPYSGGYVLDTHAAPRRSIHAMQIEVCRSAYLDARLAEPGPRLPGVVRVLTALVRTLAEDVARHGNAGALDLAAQ